MNSKVKLNAQGGMSFEGKEIDFLMVRFKSGELRRINVTPKIKGEVYSQLKNESAAMTKRLTIQSQIAAAKVDALFANCLGKAKDVEANKLKPNSRSTLTHPAPIVSAPSKNITILTTKMGTIENPSFSNETVEQQEVEQKVLDGNNFEKLQIRPTTSRKAKKQADVFNNQNVIPNEFGKRVIMYKESTFEYDPVCKTVRFRMEELDEEVVRSYITRVKEPQKLELLRKRQMYLKFMKGEEVEEDSTKKK